MCFVYIIVKWQFNLRSFSFHVDLLVVVILQYKYVPVLLYFGSFINHYIYPNRFNSAAVNIWLGVATVLDPRYDVNEHLLPGLSFDDIKAEILKLAKQNLSSEPGSAQAGRLFLCIGHDC